MKIYYASGEIGGELQWGWEVEGYPEIISRGLRLGRDGLLSYRDVVALIRALPKGICVSVTSRALCRFEAALRSRDCVVTLFGHNTGILKNNVDVHPQRVYYRGYLHSFREYMDLFKKYTTENPIAFQKFVDFWGGRGIPIDPSYRKFRRGKYMSIDEFKRAFGPFVRMQNEKNKYEK